MKTFWFVKNEDGYLPLPDMPYRFYNVEEAIAYAEQFPMGYIVPCAEGLDEVRFVCARRAGCMWHETHVLTFHNEKRIP